VNAEDPSYAADMGLVLCKMTISLRNIFMHKLKGAIVLNSSETIRIVPMKRKPVLVYTGSSTSWG
jgi:hypothetical protein